MTKKKIDYIRLLKEELELTNNLVENLENYNKLNRKVNLISFIEETKRQYDNIHKIIFKSLIEEFITKFNREDIYAISKQIIETNDSLYILIKIFNSYQINYFDFDQIKLIQGFKVIIKCCELILTNIDKIDIVFELLEKLEQQININIENYLIGIKRLNESKLEFNSKIQFFDIYNIYITICKNIRELKYKVEQLIIKNI